jgi:hypothetical protein
MGVRGSAKVTGQMRCLSAGWSQQRRIQPDDLSLVPGDDENPRFGWIALLLGFEGVFSFHRAEFGV